MDNTRSIDLRREFDELAKAKLRVLDEAARAACAAPPSAADGAAAEAGGAPTGVDPAQYAEFCKFLRRYYRHTAAEDLVERAPKDLYGAALSHRDLASVRPQGTAKVRVFTPSDDQHGWSTGGHAVVEIVINDMPFLVNSVIAELNRHGRGIHLLVHPQLLVRRDLAGRLLEVYDTLTPPDGVQGVELESWMHIEVEGPNATQADDDELVADLQRVLRDVREAVEDWQKMRDRAAAIAAEVRAQPPTGIDQQEVAETAELLDWLVDDHFTFMGYREYALEPVQRTVDRDGGGRIENQHDPVDHVLRAIPGTGLGILRSDQSRSTGFSRLSREERERAREPHLLVLTKANSRSTIHRPSYLDYVGIKVFDDGGAVVGERRFLGLFSSAAYNESIQRMPVLRRKAEEVLARVGFPPTSHSGKDLMQILETYPRDELFQISVNDLEPIVVGVLHLQERRQLRLFLRRDPYGRFMSCLVYLPRDRYTTSVRRAMEQILLEAFEGRSIDYTARVSESVLARLHFVVRVDPERGVPDVDPREVERQLVAATRSWDDDFSDALAEKCGEDEASRLAAVYAKAFPQGYKEDLDAQSAVDDLLQLERLRDDADIALGLYRPPGARPGETRFKLFHVGAPVSLSRVLPRLQEMGVEVVDERPYEVPRPGRPTAWVYDFGLRYEPSGEAGDEQTRTLFQDAFAAVWSGATEGDRFNALVLRGALNWRQTSVLRAYAKYLRQGGSTFSQSYIEECLTSNVHIARLLVRLFEARFDPTRQSGSGEVIDGLLEEIGGSLDAVASLDQDRILRAFLGSIQATLRTNYFQVQADGTPKPYLSFKLDPQRVPDLPAPRPAYEIWVHSPRVEGVHLRFGPVARGGLRWSDRREDFRTEVLGLVKAQTVKNAVIVPVGAKGGFVVKVPPSATGDAAADREALLAEGIDCYRTFIRGMLDITDNLETTDGKASLVSPERVVRHDDDDAYLVVAADKGTATFSDIANGVANEYGFWLGDAFASGGSAGYDHKAMGITARGAWESVKRHFREVGRNIQNEDFTVVGIGDMSGDVFGNGMLLSQHIKLVAAFDHRHIFLDPSPDPATSFAERQRLFELPRSSWADYDQSLMSQGGGVYPRTAKSVPVSAQVRERLRLPEGVTKLTPNELLRAIVAAPVDLLWNGGIGTYVKASTESHAQVGDKANDAIRVDGRQLRARVVGEGGNLGFTQLGRIEYALLGCEGAGGRINTDAIDNSAGVDTSDHEVNIKILLDRVVDEGVISRQERNDQLAAMTDEVASLVLADNYEQNVLLGNARRQSSPMLSVHRRFIRHLETRGALNRELEFLPDEGEIERRQAANIGLTSSELAILVAYSKITLSDQILESGLPDEPWFRRELRGYFPSGIVSRYDDRLDDHPLRREIITTCVSNDAVNRAGITFVFRAQEETGATPVEIVRAYTVIREVYQFQEFWSLIEALDNQVPTDGQTMLYLDARRLLDRGVRWLLQTRRAALDVAREVEHFGPDVQALAPQIPQLLVGSERERLHERAAALVERGIPDELALRAAGLLDAFSLLDIVEIATAISRPGREVAEIYFALSEQFQVDDMLTRITALPRADRWSALARSSLRYDLYAALAGLTSNVISSTAQLGDAQARIASWEEQNAEGLNRARGTLQEISSSDTSDLATMSVALRTIRTLLRS